MYKAKADGSIEVGKLWNLTNDDRYEIASIIADHCNVSVMGKCNGCWEQQSTLRLTNKSYRIVDL